MIVVVYYIIMCCLVLLLFYLFVCCCYQELVTIPEVVDGFVLIESPNLGPIVVSY